MAPTGAAVGGFAAAASGQIAANYFAIGCGCNNGEPLPISDLLTSPKFWGTSIGGAFGAGVGAGAGQRAATAIGRRIYGSGPMFFGGGLRAGVEGFVSEGIAGSSAAVGEALGGLSFSN